MVAVPVEADRRKARSDLANAAKKAAKNPADRDAAAQVEYLRTEYRTVALAEYIRKLVDTAPPLTAEQRAHLAGMLAPRAGGS